MPRLFNKRSSESSCRLWLLWPHARARERLVFSLELPDRGIRHAANSLKDQDVGETRDVLGLLAICFELTLRPLRPSAACHCVRGLSLFMRLPSRALCASFAWRNEAKVALSRLCNTHTATLEDMAAEKCASEAQTAGPELCSLARCHTVCWPAQSCNT